jgi:hypothetical protein
VRDINYLILSQMTSLVTKIMRGAELNLIILFGEMNETI